MKRAEHLPNNYFTQMNNVSPDSKEFTIEDDIRDQTPAKTCGSKFDMGATAEDEDAQLHALTTEAFEVHASTIEPVGVKLLTHPSGPNMKSRKLLTESRNHQQLHCIKENEDKVVSMHGSLLAE